MPSFPYLLQGVLEKLWEDRDHLDESSVGLATSAFLREHADFSRWLDAFDEPEHAIYSQLIEAEGNQLHVREIRSKISVSLRPQIDDALLVLGYHGLIDDIDSDEPELAGTMFRDWYLDNRPAAPGTGAAAEPEERRKPLVFISYSHKDEERKKALDTHLSILSRQSVIETWHARKIIPGQEFDDEINKNLEAADIIMLLVSSDFMASDYCYTEEMTRAIERHDAGETRVIPVIVRSVDWTDAPFAKLTAAPTDGKAVASWTDPDEAWTDVVKGIKMAVEELRPGD